MAADATGVGVRVSANPNTILVDVRSALKRVVAAMRRGEYLVPAIAAGLLVAIIPFALALARTGRDEAVGNVVARVDLTARFAAAEISRLAGGRDAAASHLSAFAKRLFSRANERATLIILSDLTGAIVSVEGADDAIPHALQDVLHEGRHLIGLGELAGAMPVTIADGRDAVVAVRNVPGGQVTVIEPLARRGTLFSAWAVAPLLVAAAAFAGLIGLAGTCLPQIRRRRAAAREDARNRRRIDMSLARGRAGVWDWDITRGQVYWSASMYDLIGRPRGGEFLSLAEVNALIHPADENLCAIVDRIAAAETTQLDHEFRVQASAGRWLWLRARAEVTVDPQDGSRHLVGIAVDVTEERTIAEHRAMADMRLRDAVEAVSEAFVLWDAENRLVLCNSKFRDLHGLTAEQAVSGATYAAIMDAARPPVIEYQLAHDIPDAAGSRTLEAQLSDGRWLHINERRTKDGGYVSVGTDITTMKRHEEKLVHSERRLIASVKDLQRSRRTLQIQAQQLAELAERNIEANRAKTDFLAKMSHELRTPLNAVIGFADVMQHQLFGALGNPRYLDYARDIQTSGEFLLSIIEDILQMSRIEAGQVDLDMVPIAISPTIDAALATIRATADAKHIGLSVSCDRDVVLQADGRALREILTHLLQNAAKFTPKGGDIRVRVKQAAGAVNIFVEDNGIGIPRDFLPRLGRPFEQVEPEFNRANGGSGLGLAICKALTAMHGGNLRIRSEEGIGTAVLIHMPLRQGAPANDRPEPWERRQRAPMLIAAE